MLHKLVDPNEKIYYQASQLGLHCLQYFRIEQLDASTQSHQNYWFAGSERLFLTVPRGCLQFVIVVFPDHTHLLFFNV